MPGEVTGVAYDAVMKNGDELMCESLLALLAAGVMVEGGDICDFRGSFFEFQGGLGYDKETNFLSTETTVHS